MEAQPSAANRQRRDGRPRFVGKVAFASWLRQLDWVEKVFGVVLALIGIHLADAAIEGLRFGGPANQLVALVPLLLLPGLFTLFVWRGRVVRTLLAWAVGIGAVALGLGVYLPHLILGQAEGSDYTGSLATLAGVVALVLAFRVGLRGRRWFIQIAVIAISLVVLVQWVFLPAGTAAMHVNVARTPIPSAQTLAIPGAADVTFPSRDGVRLAAWYVPGSNGAAVILLHGTGDSRLGMVEHLRMLAAAGYAVLDVDARGHGQSAGQPNSWGWRASDTLAGAVDFLGHQPGIDPHRIAALGHSTGAIEALRAAAEGVPLAAVIADGPGPLTLGDQAAELPALEAGWLVAIDQSSMWLTMRLTTLYSGDAEPTPLVDIAGRIRVPVLLISANPTVHSAIGHPPGERILAEVYRERIGAKAELWYLSDVGHGEGLRLHPQAYTARVTAFLATSLQ